ncbi:MAG: sulfotransferase [Bacteroidales bacterium]|nr:sulfotransferase [Bacteroidales bacterium]MCF8350608.1 sulfotransferase [Bacteroidales bacterium]MCF8377159.1 sulfotransferase [Bacteroidales bacterium]
MRDCIICGFGRSGTSLMGALLYQAGYYMGNELYPGRESNPLGFFECEEVNTINEEILSRYDSRPNSQYIFSQERKYSPFNPMNGQRWLTHIADNIQIIPCDKSNIESRISELIINAKKNSPIAFKDPRFNYTLEIWDKYLKKDTLIICMYREPTKTIESILKMTKYDNHLSNFYIDSVLAYQLWYNSYNYFVYTLTKKIKKEIIFINYTKLLNKSILPTLSEMIGVKLDIKNILPELDRCTGINFNPPKYIIDTYKKLDELSQKYYKI